MRLSLSERNRTVMQSEIRSMSTACRRVGGINLSQGVCDTPVPREVIEGAVEAMRSGVNSYTHYAGLIELRRALAGKYRRFYGAEYDPGSEIVVTAGATGALYAAFQALLDPGDEVILFEPYYGYHVTTLEAAGAVPVVVPLDPNGWGLDADALTRAASPRTKGIVVNTPANPSGKVFTQEELLQIADFATQLDLFVFTDEIYEHFLYEGHEHAMMASLPGMRERTITVSGLSKTFSVTGWRIGYALCDERWAQAIGHFNDLVYVCAPAPLQLGAARGIELLGPEFYDTLAEAYLGKRDRFCQALVDAALTPSVPDGAYYVLADVSRLPGSSCRERAMHILDATGVAAVPGSAFFAGGRGEELVRFCFAKEDMVLDEAAERLRLLA